MPRALEILKCKFECILPEKSACYELENGTIFLFKFEPPYVLSAVVNNRKICLGIDDVKNPLICAGAYRNALYFYSTPPTKCQYEFFRAKVDADEEVIRFRKIREIQTNSELIQFAHHQPFYATCFQHGSHSNIVRGFEEEDAQIYRPFKPGNPFFKHKRPGDGSAHVETASPSPLHKPVVISLPEPEKAAILSRWDTGFLYILARNTLLIFVDSELVVKLDVQCPSVYRRKLDFNSTLGFSGDHDRVLLISAVNASDNEVDLWSVQLPNKYCDKAASSLYGECGVLSFSKDEDEEDGTYTVEQLPILMKQTTKNKIARQNWTITKMPNSSSQEICDSNKRGDALVETIKNLHLQDSGHDFKSKFLKDFKPTKVLGNGTFGCVFEAEKNLYGFVSWKSAVKRIPLRESKQGMEEDLREVAAMIAFKHSGIRSKDADLLKSLNYVGYIQYKDDCAFLYIQMELCDSSLADWLTKNGERDLTTIKTWFKQIVSAVEYIHKKGKIHRDLKPYNILITSEGIIKICDLGIIADCFFENEEEKAKSRTFGRLTKMYSAPEQYMGDYSSKVDIFALGLILVEMCVVMTIDEADKVFDKYRSGKPTAILDGLPEVKEFVAWLTRVNVTERPDCSEILQHPFLG